MGKRIRICQNIKTDFYEYHSSLIEPWDGPAAVFFTDGTQIGATLDRNGLRPAKYVITKNGQVAMASELGVLEFEPEEVIEKGRLNPGKMFLVDTKIGKIIDDAQLKKSIATKKPYGNYIDGTKKTLEDFKDVSVNNNMSPEVLREEQQAFGYTMEDLKLILKYMAESGKEPIGSMGNDTPLAVLSNRPQILFSYFRQLFAQVTNPPIDPIREGVVMSLMNYLGPQNNILSKGKIEDPFIELENPILTDAEMAKIKNMRNVNV